MRPWCSIPCVTTGKEARVRSPRRLPFALLLVLLAGALPAVAQEPADGEPLLGAVIPPLKIELAGAAPAEAAEEEPGEPPAEWPTEPAPPTTAERPSIGIVAAAWCAMRSGAAEPVAEGEEPPPGCDFGVGASLWGWEVPGRGWLSVVAAIGAESFAVGVAWTVLVMEHPVSVGLGLMIPHGGGTGIDLELVAPAVGANFGFQGGS